jgi:hypothetical protein
MAVLPRSQPWSRWIHHLPVCKCGIGPRFSRSDSFWLTVPTMARSDVMANLMHETRQWPSAANGRIRTFDDKCPGTGQWFTATEMRKWVQGTEPLYWICGPGKNPVCSCKSFTDRRRRQWEVIPVVSQSLTVTCTLTHCYTAAKFSAQFDHSSRPAQFSTYDLTFAMEIAKIIGLCYFLSCYSWQCSFRQLADQLPEYMRHKASLIYATTDTLQWSHLLRPSYTHCCWK